MAVKKSERKDMLQKAETRQKREEGRRGRAHRNLVLFLWCRAEQSFYLKSRANDDRSIEKRTSCL